MRTERARIQLLGVAMRMRGHVLQGAATLTGNSGPAIVEYVLIPVLAATGVGQINFFNARQLIRTNPVRWNGATIGSVRRLLGHLPRIS